MGSGGRTCLRLLAGPEKQQRRRRHDFTSDIISTKSQGNGQFQKVDFVSHFLVGHCGAVALVSLSIKGET